MSKRLAAGVAALATLSVVSFCFFASQPGTTPSGRPVLREYWTWLVGVGSGRSLHLLTHPAPTRLSLQRATMLEALGHTSALLGVAFVLVVTLSVVFALAAGMGRGSALDLPNAAGMLVVTVTSLTGLINLVGDGLDEALNPRTPRS